MMSHFLTGKLKKYQKSNHDFRSSFHNMEAKYKLVFMFLEENI
jgi:hypothetical protein